MIDLAWGLFSIACMLMGAWLFYTALRVKLTPRPEWNVQDGEAGEFDCPPTLRDGTYAAAQMSRRCVHRLSCYCACSSRCALFAEAAPADLALIRNSKRLKCITGG